MALKFSSSGKPVKSIVQPATLEEAFNPVDTPVEWAQKPDNEIATHIVSIVKEYKDGTSYVDMTAKDKLDALASVIKESKVPVQGPIHLYVKDPNLKNEVIQAAEKDGIPYVDMADKDNLVTYNSLPPDFMHELKGLTPEEAAKIIALHMTKQIAESFKIPEHMLSGKDIKYNEEGIKSLQETAAQTVDQVALSQKQEPQGEVVTELANSEVLDLVDKYCQLQEIIDSYDISALLKEQEGLKKQLQSIAKADHFPSGKSVHLYGTHANYVEFSPQTNSTKITDKVGLVEKIGMETWFENTDITLTAVKKLLSENELAKFTSIVPGARTLKSVHQGGVNAKGKSGKS